MTGGAQITEIGDDHVCLTFCEHEELLDLTAAFVRDGLAAGAKVVWLSGLEPAAALAEMAGRGLTLIEAAAEGRMVVGGHEEGLLLDRSFDLEHATTWLKRQVGGINGFPRLRIALDMSWALRPVSGVEQLPGFEERVGELLEGAPVSVLCQYDRDRFDPVTLASVAASHPVSVAAATYHHDAVLRICRQYAPPGIRIAGEIDHLAADPLAMALQEALRLDGDITVNMADLHFADASSIRMIIEAARAHPGTTTLRCGPAVLPRFILLGAFDVPGLRLAAAHER
ncbi:MEDS domain-containing protein [Actinocorallia longicatena]|uniref:STAS domain-containing protein n=1 Tax=Actinocorallia longicatena TaxID=111803 RepID=A0ABP6QHV4_9ACTN